MLQITFLVALTSPWLLYISYISIRPCIQSLTSDPVMPSLRLRRWRHRVHSEFSRQTFFFASCSKSADYAKHKVIEKSYFLKRDHIYLIAYDFIIKLKFFDSILFWKEMLFFCFFFQPLDPHFSLHVSGLIIKNCYAKTIKL